MYWCKRKRAPSALAVSYLATAEPLALAVPFIIRQAWVMKTSALRWLAVLRSSWSNVEIVLWLSTGSVLTLLYRKQRSLLRRMGSLIHLLFCPFLPAIPPNGYAS